jgi:hypothetical protein
VLFAKPFLKSRLAKFYELMKQRHHTLKHLCYQVCKRGEEAADEGMKG